MILQFGKYRDYDLRDVPRDYIEWLLGVRKKEVAEIAGELERRDLVEEAQQSMAELIVQTGYRQLSLRFHPDQGGDADKFRTLKATAEHLKDILREGAA